MGPAAAPVRKKLKGFSRLGRGKPRWGAAAAPAARPPPRRRSKGRVILGRPPPPWPAGVRAHVGRPVRWLPPGWGQGVKATRASRLQCFISPHGRAYHLRRVVERVAGAQTAEEEGLARSDVDWARERARVSIAEGTTFDGNAPKFVADTRLFANLQRRERRHLPASAGDLYFAVVSARRADNKLGLRHLVNVQAYLVAGGADPTWYVDRASLGSYRALGLRAKIGGKLVPARNMALRDAARAGKPCVQLSDDITSWVYYAGDVRAQVDLQAGNDAAKAAERLRVCPSAAARFLLAKLRAAPELSKGGKAPKLAGVFPRCNPGNAFMKEATTWEHFVLGDFFVADLSPVRFDRRLVLKEDYDYTCGHLRQHGSVLRCNRLLVTPVHERNVGGACSNRDAAGAKEREMVEILKRKWPGVFTVNGRRGDTQVLLSWRRRRPAGSAA